MYNTNVLNCSVNSTVQKTHLSCRSCQMQNHVVFLKSSRSRNLLDCKNTAASNCLSTVMKCNSDILRYDFSIKNCPVFEKPSNLSFSLLICRTLRTAARHASWCVTSIRVVGTAASCIMWSTASWSPMVRSARSYWSHRTGATPPAAGRPSLNPSATLALTARGPPLDTGLVSNTHMHTQTRQDT